MVEALNAEIRAEAAAQRIPIKTLAEAAGIDRATLHRYLTEERDMPLSVLLRISETLNLQPSALMDRADTRATTN